jgi:uncharacterized protein with HEPN domain
MKADRERVEHILEAIQKIEKYSGRGFDAFRKEELIQNWIVRHLQIIGEASRKLSTDLRVQHSAIPWKKIIGMRDILVQDYFDIDADIVWTVVVVPVRKSQVICSRWTR